MVSFFLPLPQTKKRHGSNTNGRPQTTVSEDQARG